MSAQSSRTDHADNADRNYYSSNARTASNLHPNPATRNEAQTSANYADNQLDVEASEADARLRRRSAASSGSVNRRASRLSFNYSQGRAQPHHHHHYHHQVPQPQHNFKPFTRQSLEAIKTRINEDNARRQQIQQAQHEVSTGTCVTAQPCPHWLTLSHRATLVHTHRPRNRIPASPTRCLKLAFPCHVHFSASSHPS